MNIFFFFFVDNLKRFILPEEIIPKNVTLKNWLLIELQHKMFLIMVKLKLITSTVLLSVKRITLSPLDCALITN